MIPLSGEAAGWNGPGVADRDVFDARLSEIRETVDSTGLGQSDEDEGIAQEVSPASGSRRLCFASASIGSGAAEMKISTGAPFSICRCKVPEPAN